MRSLTIIDNGVGLGVGSCKEIAVMYRHDNGGLQNHGVELAKFLTEHELVNGYSQFDLTTNVAITGDKKIASNGMHDLAAQIIAHFKTKMSNGIYVYPAGTRNLDEGCTYRVCTNSWTGKIMVSLNTTTGENFYGSPEQFLMAYGKKVDGFMNFSATSTAKPEYNLYSDELQITQFSKRHKIPVDLCSDVFEMWNRLGFWGGKSVNRTIENVKKWLNHHNTCINKCAFIKLYFIFNEYRRNNPDREIINLNDNVMPLLDNMFLSTYDSIESKFLNQFNVRLDDEKLRNDLDHVEIEKLMKTYGYHVTPYGIIFYDGEKI